jgi:hypothetical protein
MTPSNRSQARVSSAPTILAGAVLVPTFLATSDVATMRFRVPRHRVTAIIDVTASWFRLSRAAILDVEAKGSRRSHSDSRYRDETVRIA